MDQIHNDLTREVCPFCLSADIRSVGQIKYNIPILFSTKDIQIGRIPELWKCTICESRFVQNVISENQAIALYSEGASADRWSQMPFEVDKPKSQIKCLTKYFKRNTKVLDIGCNSGLLLDFAKSLGCDTAGVEYSEKSRKLLENKGHKAFKSINDTKEKYDVITAFDLIEHIYQPNIFMEQCKNRLRDNGFFILLTGNISSASSNLCGSDWWYIKYPEHIVFPSRKYLSNSSGFQVVEWIKTYASKGYKVPISQLVKVILRGLILRKNYSGLPSIGTDHILVVLKNES